MRWISMLSYRICAWSCIVGIMMQIHQCRGVCRCQREAKRRLLVDMVKRRFGNLVKSTCFILSQYSTLHQKYGRQCYFTNRADFSPRTTPEEAPQPSWPIPLPLPPNLCIPLVNNLPSLPRLHHHRYPPHSHLILFQRRKPSFLARYILSPLIMLLHTDIRSIMRCIR
jgi:hypothetical protein